MLGFIESCGILHVGLPSQTVVFPGELVALLLVIDPDPIARERVENALGGLGYDVSFVDHPREWLPGLQVDLVLTSASALDQGARQAFLEMYEAAATGPPVLLWSPELSKERILGLMPDRSGRGGLRGGAERCGVFAVCHGALPSSQARDCSRALAP